MNKKRFFITGIDTNLGKTFVAGLLAKKLGIKYFKPIQTGSIFGTDQNFVKSTFGVECIDSCVILPAPSAPSIAAKKAKTKIDFSAIKIPDGDLVIEGAGGIMVPISDEYTVIDLIKKSNAGVIIVSNCALGSINSTVLTAMALKANNLDVLGIVFNENFDQFVCDEILRMTGLKMIINIPHFPDIESINLDDISFDI